jgi:hypothetical protein
VNLSPLRRGDSTRLQVRVLFDGPAAFGWTLALGDLMMRKQRLTLRGLAERETRPA